MSDKTLNARIIQKHDTEENWLKATNFIPKTGELIVYDIDSNYSYPRVKIGDGIKNINSLDFIGTPSAITTDEINTICGTVLYEASEVLL